MLKFYQQNSDNISNRVGFAIICSYLTEGQAHMTTEPNGAVMVQTPDTAGEGRENSSLRNGHTVDDCLLAATQLLNVIGEETDALHTFNSDLLLQLITQKEALVRELAAKLNTLKNNAGLPRRAADPSGGAEHIAGLSPHKPMAPEVAHENPKLREILRQIERNNEVNRIFIEGSLTYGQELLELFTPGTYVVGQEGQAERLTPNTKGLALNREV
jgi:flagellar biosynthesis/type III secretory pathway chaperone